MVVLDEVQIDPTFGKASTVPGFGEAATGIAEHCRRYELDPREVQVMNFHRAVLSFQRPDVTGVSRRAHLAETAAHLQRGASQRADIPSV
jgi:hypothetical protein